MNFHLEFPLTSFQNKISYTDHLMFIGSCFAENIAERLKDAKLNTNINPHGILYDPLSIAKALRRYTRNNHLKESDLFFANESWNSWEHHSRFSNNNKQKSLAEINNHIEAAHEDLLKSKWLFITFGSAFSFSLKEENFAVANCHKVSQKGFNKSLLKTEVIISEYKDLIDEIRSVNPNINIIFTVSPVRYIRDGIEENNLSKAILIQSVHKLVDQFENVNYFPAYELVIDDLRDYRFYKADLVHPNEQAIDYVLKKFIDVAFNEGAKALFERIAEIRHAQLHRPFNPHSEAHQKFKLSFAERCKKLEREFPFLDLSEELLFFNSSVSE